MRLIELSIINHIVVGWVLVATCPGNAGIVITDVALVKSFAIRPHHSACHTPDTVLGQQQTFHSVFVQS